MKKLIVGTLTWAAIFISSAALAQPYGVITRLILHTNSQQQLTSIDAQWTFDKNFSLELMHQGDANNDNKISPAEKRFVTSHLTSDFAKRDYLLTLVSGGKQYKLGLPSKATTSYNGQIVLKISAPASDSGALPLNGLRIHQRDPSGYFSPTMDTYMGFGVLIKGSAQDDCMVQSNRAHDKGDSLSISCAR